MSIDEVIALLKETEAILWDLKRDASKLESKIDNEIEILITTRIKLVEERDKDDERS